MTGPVRALGLSNVYSYQCNAVFIRLFNFCCPPRGPGGELKKRSHLFHLISLEGQLPEEEGHRERLAQLELLDEKRLRAQIYQRRIYQNKVLERRGDPVLKKIFPSAVPGMGQTGKDRMSSPRFTLECI